MATTTIDGVRASAERKRGFFARLLERLEDAQVQRARAIAKPHLLTLDDEELARFGYTRDQVRRWPTGSYWL